MQLQMQRTSRCPSTTLRCVTITLRHISTSVYSLHWRIQEFDKGERGVMGRRDGWFDAGVCIKTVLWRASVYGSCACVADMFMCSVDFPVLQAAL